MRIDVDTCRDPDLLAGEVRRLQAVIAANEQRDAAGPVDFGGLTGEERDALETARHLAAWGNGGTVAARIGELLERTKEAANMSDTNEPSLASAGSQPELWAVEWKGDTKIDRSTVCYTEDAAKRKADECPALYGVAVPLYRSPTLTDEERLAIAWAINKTAQSYDDAEGGPIKREAMRGLLQRTK